MSFWIQQLAPSRQPEVRTPMGVACFSWVPLQRVARRILTHWYVRGVAITGLQHLRSESLQALLGVGKGAALLTLVSSLAYLLHVVSRREAYSHYQKSIAQCLDAAYSWTLTDFHQRTVKKYQYQLLRRLRWVRGVADNKPVSARIFSSQELLEGLARHEAFLATGRDIGGEHSTHKTLAIHLSISSIFKRSTSATSATYKPRCLLKYLTKKVATPIVCVCVYHVLLPFIYPRPDLRHRSANACDASVSRGFYVTIEPNHLTGCSCAWWNEKIEPSEALIEIY